MATIDGFVVLIALWFCMRRVENALRKLDKVIAMIYVVPNLPKQRLLLQPVSDPTLVFLELFH